MDNKKEYIIRTFARTKRKDYENYILNRIWTKLDSLNIKPVSQQYVKRSDGKYALLDLYFPQLHIGIECDEAYHQNNQLNDEIRTLEITKMFESIGDDAFELLRIDASKSLKNVNKRIDEVVSRLNEKASQINYLEWDTEEDIIMKVIANQSIKVEENFKFKRIIDVMKLFGKDYKGMQRSYFRLKNDTYMWFPSLSIRDIDGNLISSNNSGWINAFNNDWSMIFEQREDNSVLDKQKDGKRIVFMKIKDDIMRRQLYQFVGVFEFDNRLSTNSKRVHRRKTNSLNLTEFLFNRGL